MKKFGKVNNIKLSFTSIYHPQTNGQVESTNKTIVNILKRKVGEIPSDWADLILEVLWAYRSTTKTSFGLSTFSLSFGLEGVAPVELVWPTAIIKYYNEKDKNCTLLKDWMKLWN